MSTFRLIESIQNNLQESENTIEGLHRELSNIDWSNRKQIYEVRTGYLQPLLDEYRRLIDEGYFESDDGNETYNWIKEQLIGLGFSEEDIDYHSDMMIEIQEYLENLVI